MKRKSLILILSALVLVLASVGGTLAWLSDSASVTNTFSVGKVDISASEPIWDSSDDHKLVPGKTLTKDPTVTVEAGSEEAYVFVKVTSSPDVAAVLSYEMADGWTQLTGQDGVYYRTVAASSSDQSFPVFKDNQITVKTSATNELLAKISNVAAQDYMKIAFAAIQVANVGGLEAAYAQVSSFLNT